MGTQRGRNSGITGVIDLPGISGAKFHCRVFSWKPRMTGATRQRRGRGSGLWGNVRWTMSTGTIAVTGTIRLDDWPVPDAWKGQAGTIAVQIHTGKTVSYPVLVTEASMAFDESTDELPSVVLSCQITGAPTFAGWTGTQPAATDPSKSDQEQWPGTGKTLDPQGLQSGATTIIDVWGSLDDTSAAEQVKLASVISAAVVPLTTPHNLKVRHATFSRDALDGGTVTISWGLTDTAEDVINSSSRTTTDPNGLQSSATVAQFGSAPSTPAGFQDRGVTTREYNDSKTLYVKDAGLRSTKQDVEFQTSHTFNTEDFGSQVIHAVVDSSDTETAIAKAYFDANYSDPELVDVTARKLTPNKGLLVVRTQSANLVWTARADGALIMAPARLSGGVVQVWVSQKLKRANTWEVLIEPRRMNLVRCRFDLSLRVSQVPVPWKLSYVNTTNNAEFIGCFPTGTVRYLGAAVHTNFSLPTTSGRVARMGWEFEYSNLGHFTDDGIVLGWYRTAVDMTAVTVPGWVAASTFGWAAAALSQNDFDYFTDFA